MQRSIVLTFVLIASLVLAACAPAAAPAAVEAPAEATEAPAEEAAPEVADIVDTAVAAGSFTTLAAALEAAGLVETLKGEGPVSYTHLTLPTNREV